MSDQKILPLSLYELEQKIDDAQNMCNTLFSQNDSHWEHFEAKVAAYEDIRRYLIHLRDVFGYVDVKLTPRSPGGFYRAMKEDANGHVIPK